MSVTDLGVVVAALLALPIGFLTALWARRSGERAADATVSAGLSQAGASITAARVQTHGGHQLRHHAVLAGTVSAFLCAADALARSVRHLPGVAHDQRSAQLAVHGMAVQTAFGPLELSAPPDLLPHAKALLEYCGTLEELALDRAVLRSAVETLESGWCPLNAEICDDQSHQAAFLAWGLLCDWPGKEEEGRWSDRDFLKSCLQDSDCMPSDEAARVLALADRCPPAWSRMIGGFVRDPLMEGYTALRTQFVESARSARTHAACHGPHVGG
ncbi:hypothetical protein [Streptomyces sp. NPDC020965]|uniref:hypothetical protein n=1 Tax=Streptomyces sp. NPDC020965 TaxID=3365105 RepID=UPI0037BC46BF